VDEDHVEQGCEVRAGVGGVSTRSENAKRGWVEVKRSEDEKRRLEREAGMLREQGLTYAEIAARQGIGRDLATTRARRGARHG